MSKDFEGRTFKYLTGILSVTSASIIIFLSYNIYTGVNILERKIPVLELKIDSLILQDKDFKFKYEKLTELALNNEKRILIMENKNYD